MSTSVHRQLSRNQPGTYFCRLGPCLGWSMGAALGAKLAAPDKTVATLIGDGAFNFDSPVATLWASKVYHAPFLTVIYNNKELHEVKSGIRSRYGKESFLEKTGEWTGAKIESPPDYAMLAQACGAYGQTVVDPSEVEPAL